MTRVSEPFPKPDEHGLDVSNRLGERIRAELHASDGWMGFERYMQFALYEPELGYYHNGSRKFGFGGDFVTAPELSSLFAKSIANEVSGVLVQLHDPVILEIGAGTGRFAQDMINALRSRSIDVRYLILEPSAELRARQQERLASAHLDATWLEKLPADPVQGVILANEVLDAFPVTCFVKREGETRPLGVGLVGESFEWVEGETEPGLTDRIAALEARLGRVLPDGFRSEICPAGPAWMASAASALDKGAILAIDYGLVEREYYHPQRDSGTLICHYRHRAHANPFLWPGLQDISAWVDFSACARAAESVGLAVSGFTTQGQFLIEGGAAERLGEPDDSTPLQAAQALKTLILPGEMGERFKLLLLSRDLPLGPPPGRDFRNRL